MEQNDLRIVMISVGSAWIGFCTLANGSWLHATPPKVYKIQREPFQSSDLFSLPVTDAFARKIDPSKVQYFIGIPRCLSCNIHDVSKQWLENDFKRGIVLVFPDSKFHKAEMSQFDSNNFRVVLSKDVPECPKWILDHAPRIANVVDQKLPTEVILKDYEKSLYNP